MSKRREYSPEFKREAVELSQTVGVTLAQIARELGIGANMLSRWRRELSEDGAKAFLGHGKAQGGFLGVKYNLPGPQLRCLLFQCFQQTDAHPLALVLCINCHKPNLCFSRVVEMQAANTKRFLLVINGHYMGTGFIRGVLFSTSWLVPGGT